MTEFPRVSRPQEWAEEDLEDDDWHEDTYSWREKDRKKHTKVFDPNDPEEFLSQALAGSGMQMIFVTLFPDTHVDKKQTEALGTTWASEFPRKRPQRLLISRSGASWSRGFVGPLVDTAPSAIPTSFACPALPAPPPPLNPVAQVCSRPAESISRCTR